MLNFIETTRIMFQRMMAKCQDEERKVVPMRQIERRMKNRSHLPPMINSLQNYETKKIKKMENKFSVLGKADDPTTVIISSTTEGSTEIGSESFGHGGGAEGPGDPPQERRKALVPQPPPPSAQARHLPQVTPSH